MKKEEKEAIKYLEFLSNEKCECKVCQNAKKHYKTILNIIEKQQKEIEKLQFVNNLIIKWNEQLDNECISKDKIRKIIYSNNEDLEIILKIKKLLEEN